MKRSIVTLTAMFMALSLLALPASAHDDVPEHGHMLLLHADWEPNPDFDPDDPGSQPLFVYSYRKCIDVANNQQIRAHHTSIHQGRARAGLIGAGHLVIPTAPLSFIADCDALAALLPPS